MERVKQKTKNVFADAQVLTELKYSTVFSRRHRAENGAPTCLPTYLHINISFNLHNLSFAIYPNPRVEQPSRQDSSSQLFAFTSEPSNSSGAR